MAQGKQGARGGAARQGGLAMKMLAFTLPVVPTAQARPRHTRHGHTYKSAGQIAAEQTLEALLVPHIPENALDGPLELCFMACLPIPKSAGKKAREAMLGGISGHTKKPDLDNLAKQLMDAMTRLRFWNDDRQITRLVAEKRYSDSPCWQITLKAA